MDVHKTSRVTEIGLRATLHRMMEHVQPGVTSAMWTSVHLFRPDGHILKLALECPVDDMVQVALYWGIGEDDTVLSPFLEAMDRCMMASLLGASASGAPGRLVLATVDPQLQHCYTFLGKDAVPHIYAAVQEALSCELCACGRSMKPGGDLVCLTCMAECGPDDIAKEMCGVCHETCVAPIGRTECCQQYLHQACRLRCQRRCPFCRARWADDTAHGVLGPRPPYAPLAPLAPQTAFAAPVSAPGHAPLEEGISLPLPIR